MKHLFRHRFQRQKNFAGCVSFLNSVKFYTCKLLPKVDVQDEEQDSGTWCYCKEDKGGEMVACDGKSCPIKWFHLDCVGLSTSTVPQCKWLCPTCHANKSKAKEMYIMSSHKHVTCTVGHNFTSMM